MPTIQELFQRAAENIQRSQSTQYLAQVESATKLIVDAFRSGHRLYVYGNGGSAADAQHICAELMGRFLLERKGLSAIALTENSALLTAVSNDLGFETIFERQIRALGQPGDVAWAISTSGNSPNVVRATSAAREIGMHTIGMTGQRGGSLKSHCDVILAVDSNETPRIQEVHLVTYHAICQSVESTLFS